MTLYFYDMSSGYGILIAVYVIILTNMAFQYENMEFACELRIKNSNISYGFIVSSYDISMSEYDIPT